MYSSKRFTIKRCDIASLKLIRNVKCAINIEVVLALLQAQTEDESWGRIHESGITYDGLISRPDITRLTLYP